MWKGKQQIGTLQLGRSPLPGLTSHRGDSQKYAPSVQAEEIGGGLHRPAGFTTNKVVFKILMILKPFRKLIAFMKSWDMYITVIYASMIGG